MNFNFWIISCLLSKNAYLASSRLKNKENIERTFKSTVTISYTGIFCLINIVVESENVLDLSIAFLAFTRQGNQYIKRLA